MTIRALDCLKNQLVVAHRELALAWIPIDVTKALVAHIFQVDQFALVEAFERVHFQSVGRDGA
jgi:hypothetical protein